MNDHSRISDAVAKGAPDAADNLFTLVYEELRRLAAAKLAQEAQAETLSPTGLIHEAYLRLGKGEPFADRNRFFAAASQAMRHILIDRARARKAAKRGGAVQRVPIEVDRLQARFSDDDMIDLDSVLDALAQVDGAAAELVRLHVFVGLSIEEAAEAQGVSRAAAYRNWTFARAWLRDALAKNSEKA